MAVAQLARSSTPRREQILRAAAALFAEYGFHGTTVEQLGRAVGITAPALYRHFDGKDDLLAQMLVGVSEHLLEGGRQEVAAATDPADALRRLVAFHAAFAAGDPALITVQERDLANLAPEHRRRVRRLQRAYVEVWVAALRRRRPRLAEPTARATVHACFGLLNSSPFAGRDLPAARTAALLRELAARVLDPSAGAPDHRLAP